MPGQVLGGGGQRYQGVQAAVPDRSDATANLLLKIGDGYLQRKLGEEQQNQFVQGMQKVAVGEAYQDIKKGDNPVLSDIFGPSATVQGAAAMARVQGVEDFTSAAYADMEGNASMSPGQFRERLVAGMSKHLTGDPTVDNVVQTKMVENLGPLMKAQAKANYGYIQKQAEIGFNGVVSSAGDKLHNIKIQAANGTLSPADAKLAEGSFLSSLMPVGGMNEDTYRKSILGVAVNQMSKGNLWADKVMRQNGMYDKLSPEDQTKLETARNSAEARTKNEFGFNKYGPQIGEILGGAEGRSPAASMAMMNALNKRYMDETGSDQGLFDIKDATSVNKAFFSRAYRNQDKNRELVLKASLDAQAEGRLAVQAVQGVQLGQGNYMVDSGVPRGKFNSAFNERFTSLMQKDPGEALDLATQNYSHGNGYINPQLQGMLLEPFRQIEQGGVPGPEFDRTMQFLDNWQSRKESGSSIDGYLGAENVIKLQRYRAAMAGLGDKSAAAKAAFGSPITKGPSLSSQEMKPLMLKTIVEKQQGATGMMAGISRWISGIPSMTESSQDLVLQAIKPDAELYMNNLGMNPQAAMAKAMEGAAKQKVDVLGRYAYQKRPDQAPLAAMSAMDDETMSKVMPQFLQFKAREQGIAVNLEGGGAPKGRAGAWSNTTDLTNWYGGGNSDVMLNRDVDGVDQDGKPYAIMFGTLQVPDKTKSAIVKFTSKELADYYNNVLRKQVDQRKQDRADLTDPAKPFILP